jgi:hypothetical protein
MVAGPDYVLLASPLTLAATGVPLDAAFVPWLRDVISQRLGSGGTLWEAAPGDTVALPAGADSLADPDGVMQPIVGGRLTVPERSGVYLVRRSSSTLGALVVNQEIHESEVEAWGAALWTSQITGTSVQLIEEADEVNAAVFDRSGGRPITWPLVLVAVIALALEALIARGLLSPRAAPVRA